MFFFWGGGVNLSFKENIGREQLLEKMNPKIAKGLISQLAVQVREQSEFKKCIWLVFCIDIATRWDSLSKIICIKCNQGSKSF